jgi:uncharacterized protein YdcH (DUF465 family)
MSFLGSFFISASGLFDFDLTFPAEAILFIILALVVTFIFLSPISKEIDNREDFINYNLRKSIILVTLGYERLSKCIALLTEETEELNRQIKLVKNYSNLEFEEEISNIQKQNINLLSKLKGKLAIKSAYLFSSVSKDLVLLTDNFFVNKFKSVS